MKNYFLSIVSMLTLIASTPVYANQENITHILPSSTFNTSAMNASRVLYNGNFASATNKYLAFDSQCLYGSQDECEAANDDDVTGERGMCYSSNDGCWHPVSG